MSILVEDGSGQQTFRTIPDNFHRNIYFHFYVHVDDMEVKKMSALMSCVPATNQNEVVRSRPNSFCVQHCGNAHGHFTNMAIPKNI